MARRSTLAASTRHALPFHPPIVVDAGAAYLRVGVASEPRPRAVVATPAALDPVRVVASRGKRPSAEEWAALLAPVVDEICYEHVLVKTKEHCVVVCDPLLWPVELAEGLARAFFDVASVLSVAFIPAPLLCVAATGMVSGLVVDVGMRETRVTPVAEQYPLVGNMQVVGLGASAVVTRLRGLLAASSVADDAAAMTEAELADAAAAHCVALGSEEEAHQVDVSDAIEIYVAALGRSIDVPLSLFANAPEALFDGACDTSDGRGLAEVVLDVLLRCDVDVRPVVARNAVFCGTITGMPGLGARLLADVRARCASERRYASLHPVVEQLALNAPPCEGWAATWFGGAAIGGTGAAAIERWTIHKPEDRPDSAATEPAAAALSAATPAAGAAALDWAAVSGSGGDGEGASGASVGHHRDDITGDRAASFAGDRGRAGRPHFRWVWDEEKQVWRKPERASMRRWSSLRAASGIGSFAERASPGGRSLSSAGSSPADRQSSAALAAVTEDAVPVDD